ncbi:MAG TPA: aryl-sulfate sulfotransferase [Clostridia bacterium]|nr:aryl-sulfate sulfotransferase [Clostridia bacterium]
MTNRENKAVWIRGILALLALILVVAGIWVFDGKSPGSHDQAASSGSTPEDENNFQLKLQFVMDQLAVQSDMDASIQAELATGEYTFDQPLVVVNPYGISPLSAVVVFTTDAPANIFVHVPGVDSLSDVDFSFEDYGTEHIVPVYGLYADTVNTVSLTATTKDGAKQSTTVDIETEALSDEIDNIVLRTDLVQPSRYQPGLNFMYQTKAAFDVNGEFRWYLKGDYQFPTNYEYQNGHFLVMLGSSYVENPALFLEINPLGRIFKVLYTPYACHHIMEQYEGDSILVAGSKGETIEDLIYEMNTTTGEIVQTLDLKTVFQRVRAGFLEPENPDWLHLNDIEWVKGTNDIIISSRNQSFVARISWPDGAIQWILAAHDDWSEMFQKYLLTPIGDEFEWSYNQHSPLILPDQDNNPDTMDLLVYDNGDQRSISEDAEPYTRIVHYQIDEVNHTIRQIWQYGKELGEALYANSRGNATPVANGNLVASYCLALGKTFRVDYREIDKDSNLVWQTEACTKQKDGMLIEFRVTRMPIYSQGTTDSVYGSEAINLIPAEVFSYYEVQ